VKAHETVNKIFVKTALLNVWQSNYSYTEKNLAFNHFRGIHQTDLYSENVVESGQVFNQHIGVLEYTAVKGENTHEGQHGPNSQSLK